ncbi:MAG: polysaccharide export protein [Caulobacteraceae bacterium]|nr:polysaccharide export protein [Caulobacteraceae bacterium]
MRRFDPAIRFVPVFAALALSGCAGMPQIQVTMPGARAAAYRGPSMGSAPMPAYGSPSMGSASPSAYAPQTMGGAAGGFPNIGYSDWSDAEPAYRFYPGDVLTIAGAADPAINGDYTVAPDGRIATPWVSPVMVSGQSVEDVRAGLRSAYMAAGMVNPAFNVAAKTTTPITVYVGGEVGAPNEYPITGDANALQAVLKAGGFKPSAKQTQVVILRHGPNGQVMQRVANLSANGGGGRDLVPLRRGDIVYVPRSNIAEVGAWMSQVRDALPIQFGYNLNGY